MRRGIASIYMLCIALLWGVDVSAQEFPERSLVRNGNRQFAKLNYRSSLNRYNEALEHDTTSYEALYNRANAYHQLRVSTPADSTLNAETTYSYYEAIAADTLLGATRRAEVLRNLGEVLFSEERYEAALNAFRESLRLNPDDGETKYDYILTKRIVDQKRNAQQQQQQNNEQNQDNQQNDQQNPDGEDNNQNNQDKGDNQQDNPNNEPNSDDEQQPQEGENEENESSGDEGEGDEGDEEDMPTEPRELSADMERMLDAVQAEEDKTQDKLKEGERAVVIRGKKNW